METYDDRPEIFADASREEWRDWHWQQRNRLRRPEEFAEVVELTDEERAGFEAADGEFRAAVTPYYAALMDPEEPSCPVRRQAIPHADEDRVRDFELEDPLAEESHMPVPGITHRYPDRVLFYVTHNCPVYCRHCTRKRKVSDPQTAASRGQIERGLEYIAETPEVRDVLVSGGDPLTLSDERLAEILERLEAIEHLEVVRIGTRNPVTLPHRVTDGLCEALERFRPVYLNTHFNHPREVTPEARRALGKLLEAGCVLGNQMVLLRGVNDDPETVMELNRRLLAAGCRPYYILQCDMARGITHFRTALERGLEIMEHLRGRIAGMGVPDFVVDLPGGGGKVELVPEYIERENNKKVVFRNWEGEEFVFEDVEKKTAGANRGGAEGAEGKQRGR